MPDLDPRVSPVEDNLEHFFHRVIGGIDWLDDRSTSHVLAYSSHVAFPMFNLVIAADFEAVRAGELGQRVAGDFIDRGLPWMWWTTPTHTSPELEDTLGGLGLSKEEVPGMYVELDQAPETAASVQTVETSPRDPDLIRVLIEGFGLPRFVEQPFQDVLAAFTDQEQTILLARKNGRPVGVGTGLITGETLGIYNVATLKEARGQGVGTAVTAALMQAGRKRGASHAILHASSMGRRVYEGLGFEVVCPTAHWVWIPPR